MGGAAGTYPDRRDVCRQGRCKPTECDWLTGAHYIDTATYEALAIEIATNPEKLASIKSRLAHNRLIKPLFDTPRFTRNMEAAYTALYQRYQAGLPPDHIYVAG